MKKIIFEKSALWDLQNWKSTNSKVYEKIVKLISEISQDPFKGSGKPEALKHQLSGYWSRRINKKDRLVYKVTQIEVIIVACKYHYY